MDFAPHVRLARRFLYMAFAVQLVEPSIRVRLQHPAEPGQMRLRVVNLALTLVQPCLQEAVQRLLFGRALFKKGDVVGEIFVHEGHATKLPAS